MAQDICKVGRSQMALTGTILALGLDLVSGVLVKNEFASCL